MDHLCLEVIGKNSLCLLYTLLISIMIKTNFFKLMDYCFVWNVSITAGESDAVLSDVSKQQREPMQNNLSRQLSRDAPLSLEGRFMVKPSFLHIIRKVNGVDPKKVIFTFKEVSNIFCRNIIKMIRFVI